MQEDCHFPFKVFILKMSLGEEDTRKIVSMGSRDIGSQGGFIFDPSFFVAPDP